MEGSLGGWEELVECDRNGTVHKVLKSKVELRIVEGTPNLKDVS